MFKNKKEQTTFYITTGVILFIVILTVVADLLFPNTAIGTIITNTVGKFFNLVNFFIVNYQSILETVAIIFFIWVLNWVFGLIIRFMLSKPNTVNTFWALMKSVFKYGSSLVAVFLVLSAWGVETPTLLAGAGILGLAISFGAQSLIEDVISGLFILFEKQFVVGDIIQVNGFRGKVIEIGIRTTSFEDLNGDVMIINNSDIRMAINTSTNPSPVICDISIAYEESIERVEDIIREALPTFAEKIPDILVGPRYLGVQKLDESGVVLRIYARTDELKKYQVTRDLNREIKLLFDANNITIPFNQLVVHYGDEKKEENNSK